MTAPITRRHWLASCGLVAAGALAAPTQLRPLAVGATLPRPAGPLRLFFNENPHGPPAAAIRAATAALAHGNRYADQEDFDELAGLIAGREGVSPDHVVIGSGSAELLGATAAGYIRGSGEVVTAEPTFQHFLICAERLGARIRRVPLDAGWRHDLDRMAEAVNAETRLVHVCNPNNPTGTIVPADRLRAFCERIAPRAPVVVDEAYHELAEAPEHASMVPLVRSGVPVIVMRTFSKVYALAGFRVGYAIARPDLAERLRALQTTDASVAAVRAAIAAWQDAAFVTRSRRLIREARELTTRGFDELGLRYVPSHANFLYFEVGVARRDLPARLLARGVRIAWNPKPLEGDWARVSVGTAEEMRRFLRALRQELA